MWEEDNACNLRKRNLPNKSWIYLEKADFSDCSVNRHRRDIFPIPLNQRKNQKMGQSDDDKESFVLPLADRDVAHLPGHWLLARLGKKVLRPGGKKLTDRILSDADLRGADVLELAPGLGKTARAILAHDPKSYTGVETDAAAAHITREAVGVSGVIVHGEATSTGLDDASVDVVVAEAILTMQTDKHKAEIAREAFRVLRPGGRYAIHELALEPDEIDSTAKTEIRQALARSIKVNARPLTESEWRNLLQEAGFKITTVSFAPMALLRPSRILADEGLAGTIRFVGNVLRDSDARTRVLAMRTTFTKYRKHLAAIEIIAQKPG
jgi:ubiquinone/menaquinone biosynthesis C-methylase UbiE